MDGYRPEIGVQGIRIRKLFVLLPIGFLLLFFFYPLAAIFRLSLAPEGRLDLSGLVQLFGASTYLRVLGFTIGQAVLSTGLTLLAGLPGAFLLARYRFRGKALLRTLTTIPFVMPTVVVAAAFNALIGPRGVVNTSLMTWLGLDRPPIRLLDTLAIILIAHVFYNYTLVLRLVGGLWANLDPELENAARTLSANRWQAFWEVTGPLLLPAITAASLLIFLFTFTSFGVVLLLGGLRYATLEVEIYRQTVNLFNLPLAATLSLLQIACTFGLMLVYTRLQARQSVRLNLRPSRLTERPLRTLWERLLAVVNLLFILVLLLTPLLALLLRSLTLGGGFTLDYYLALFTNRRGSVFFIPPLQAIRNSLLFASATMILAVSLGLLAADWLARRNDWLGTLLDPIFLLPLGASAITLGFGYLVAPQPSTFNLRTSPLLIPLAHTLVAFPFVVRSVLPALRSIDPGLREAAAVLGASPGRVWREIDLPLIGRAVLVGAVFAFTVSMGEFGATVLISRPDLQTIPVAIFRFLGQPGLLNYGQALAMSTILMAVTAASFLLIERYRFGGEEF